MDPATFDVDVFLNEVEAAGIDVSMDGEELVLEAASEPDAELQASFATHLEAIVECLNSGRPEPATPVVPPVDDFPDLPEFSTD